MLIIPYWTWAMDNELIVEHSFSTTNSMVAVQNIKLSSIIMHVDVHNYNN